MLNRRDFLQKSLLCSVAMNVPASYARIISPEAMLAVLSKVVVDTRSPEGVIFAAESQRLGIQVDYIQADPTRFWYENLRPLWEAKRIPVGGFTSPEVAHCLELLARNQGAYLTYRMDHHRSADGYVQHLSFGTNALKDGVDKQAEPRGEWAAQAASLMADHSSEKPVYFDDESQIIDDRDLLLVSWIMIPGKVSGRGSI